MKSGMNYRCTCCDNLRKGKWQLPLQISSCVLPLCAVNSCTAGCDTKASGPLISRYNIIYELITAFSADLKGYGTSKNDSRIVAHKFK